MCSSSVVRWWEDTSGDQMDREMRGNGFYDSKHLQDAWNVLGWTSACAVVSCNHLKRAGEVEVENIATRCKPKTIKSVNLYIHSLGVKSGSVPQYSPPSRCVSSSCSLPRPPQRRSLPRTTLYWWRTSSWPRASAFRQNP